MKSLYTNNQYTEDIEAITSMDFPWNKLENKSILISGSTGLLGSFFIDVLMRKNTDGLNCKIYALNRTKEKALKRFSKWLSDEKLVFVCQDINIPLKIKNADIVHYVFHFASNTHPVQYSTDPIETILTNIIGLKNMLDFAVAHNTERFVFASSNEIYGENRGDTELFDESYCGYIDSNTLRAGYPESKRCGEALCQAYRTQKKLDIVIPRFTRSYGPTILESDTKAISQFIKKGIAGKDIVLKSEGDQFYSYTYAADAVAGLFFILFAGEDGNTYNIADEQSDITLKDLAELIAEQCHKSVIFEVPDSVESSGYSKATKARLDGQKIMSLGWRPRYNIKSGICRTIAILKDINQE